MHRRGDGYGIPTHQRQANRDGHRSPDAAPDIAESAEFTTPTQFTVKLKEGLTWADGSELTSPELKFSFDRQLAIADPNGPSSLLYAVVDIKRRRVLADLQSSEPSA
ncbi:MAG: peptide transporter substrate-binding protein [Mycetocola sp.]|nr:peptide transporter substrate-binding protein [Mycetocola sp.]